MKGRAALALAGLGTTVALVACGNILGLKDLELEPGDGGDESGADVHADGVAGDDGANEGSSGGDGSDGTAGGDASDAHPQDSTAGDAPPETTDGPPLDAPHDTPVDVPVDVPVDTPSDTPTDVGCGSLTSCSGSCVDLNTSDQNCGTCGHDCLTAVAGGCVGGVCQPVLMTGVATDAFDIVAVPSGGATTLYWVDQASTAWKCDAASCTPTPVHSGFTNTQRIAYDPSGTGTVFWTDYGSGGAADGAVWKYDIASSTPSSIATGRWTPQGVGADANDVYWAEAFTNQVVQYARSGGTVTPHPAGSGTTPDGLGMLGGEVYWADTGTGVAAHCAEAPCSPTSFLNGLTSPVSIGTAPGIVFVTEFSGTGGIWTYDPASTNTSSIGGVQNFPIRVASDGTTTYWVNFGSTANDGALVGCVGACTTGIAIEQSLAKPVGLAIDGKAIYYGTTGNHKLWKLAR